MKTIGRRSPVEDHQAAAESIRRGIVVRAEVGKCAEQPFICLSFYHHPLPFERTLMILETRTYAYYKWINKKKTKIICFRL